MLVCHMIYIVCLTPNMNEDMELCHLLQFILVLIKGLIFIQ